MISKITTRENFGLLCERYFEKGVGAEIGVEYGSFSKKILSQWSGKLISVDMWADPVIESHARKTLNTSRSIIVKDSSVNAAACVPDESLDFVYIDADHDYQHCLEDIHAWFPKVRHGGIVAGHDYLNWTKVQGAGCDFGVKAAVDRFCVANGYKLNVTTEDYWQGNPYPTWYFVKEIPRIIFFAWVSPDPLPSRFVQYIDGWRVLMPDYQFIQISLNNVGSSAFVEEALARKNYAVAAHYARCEKLYKYGGIYFDIDIEAVQRLDMLLSLPFFLGCETGSRVNNAVIGSAPGHSFLAACLEYMDSFDFNNPGKLGIEIETGPEMFTRIARSRGWKDEAKRQLLPGKEIIFEPEVFYPYYFDKPYHPGCVTPETYAVHHWAATWLKGY